MYKKYFNAYVSLEMLMILFYITFLISYYFYYSYSCTFSCCHSLILITFYLLPFLDYLQRLSVDDFKASVHAMDYLSYVTL